MNDYLRRLAAEQYRERYWPSKRRKTYIVVRRKKKKQTEQSVWWKVVPTVAALITLYQANLMKEALTAADRNRAIHAVGETVLAYCQKLEEPPVMRSIGVIVDNLGRAQLPLYIDPEVAKAVSREQIDKYLLELNEAGKKANQSLVTSLLWLDDKSAEIVTASASLKGAMQQLYLRSLSKGEVDWAGYYDAATGCINIHADLMNEIMDNRIYENSNRPATPTAQ